MTSPASSIEQNILPVQALFDVYGNFQTFIGQGQPFSVGSGSSLGIVDTTTAGVYYPTFATISSGTVTTLDVSSTKLSYNAATGAFSSTSFIGVLTGNSSGLSGGSTGALPYQSSANTTAFLSAGTNGYVLTLAGGLPTWAAAASTGLTITDDTTTAATRYITFTSATSGLITGANTSSTKLQFDPSTGAFTSTSLTPTNALGIAYGGTNSTATATAGGVGYGTGTAHAYTAAGTAGQVLTSNGASAPTWTNAGAGAGTVTSVDATVPSVFSVSGVPITGSGTIAITYSGTALPAANGGTGLTTPGTAGNVLTSNGSAWVSSAPSTSGLSWQSVQTANFTAVSGNGYPINTTSGAITVTLPSSPSAGNYVVLTDYAATFATNALTINPNSSKLDGNSSNGTVAINRSTTSLVYIDATQGWITFSNIVPTQSYSASYLMVAGGGGAKSGGGGAGGLLSGTTTLTVGTTYSFVVGSGGAGLISSTSTGTGTQGNSSTAFSLTAVGGGGGGNSFDANPPGGNGGSGGGGGATGAGSTTTAGGLGTSGQGNDGGTNNTINSFPYPSGGGGGAGAVGGNASAGTGGSGGAGSASSITGSSVTYAGGGGAATALSGTGGAGGSGGGGAGSGSGNGTSGTANTGGGGGGATNASTGGNGGSGIVIVSVPTANYSGTTSGSPTVTTSGSNTIISFTSSGSYTA